MRDERKSKKTALKLLLTIAIVAIFFYYLWQQDIVGSQGKLYPTKEKMCAEFAQSYLRTIQKVEPNFNDEKWQRAVDIETELHKLCTLDLSQEAIKGYKPTALDKYRNQ